MASSFTVNLADLTKILGDIKIAEKNAGNQDLNTGLPTVAGIDLVTIIGQDAALLPVGLRTVSGIFNNLLPGQEHTGQSDQPFPRLLTQELRTGSGGGVDFNGDGIIDFTPANGTNYNATGSVVDSQPRTISNLIVDQSINNPAAVEAWFNNPLTLKAFTLAHPGMTPIRPGQVAGPGELVVSNTDLSVIPNQSPDIGLSPQFNGFMTFFGQFFDHGLDLVPKGDNGNVYIPLQRDDPLFQLPTVLNPNPANFMVIKRIVPNAINITTPFVDQNQTYTSHASHQVFLREYAMVDGHPMATGSLLSGANHGLPTWAEVKAQAHTMLGIQLVDADVLRVPLLATDEYGRFIRGANGFVQIVTAGALPGDPPILIEANPADNGGLGTLIPANVVRAGTAFLDDIAHNAVPNAGLVADADNTVSHFNPNPADPQQPTGTYDDELLNQHFITGDGRGNENIGLTTVHTVFHNEHDRLVETYKVTILASGNLSLINEWLDPAHQLLALPAAGAALTWNGERLFQAGRFATEVQYQHLVFEEFARRIQPNVDPFVFTNSADLNPAIVAEFAHTVFRFGHSMLLDTVDRLDNDLTLVGTTTEQIGLIQAFLNPVAFSTNSNGSDGTLTAAQIALAGVDAGVAAGAILRGMTRQAGNEIDEFVVNALRNNLVGLPLDLPAINIARGRDAGIPSLNDARTELYALTGDAQLKPYTSWFDFAQNIKHPESIINFIAAYGTHTLITGETTLEGKRAAAMSIVFGTPQPVPANSNMVPPVLAHTIQPPADALAFLNSTGIYAPDGTGPNNDSRGGLNNVDLWVGGLAEELQQFGGMLGSTFGAVFEYQLEHLQNGDRFYYLSRTQGTNLLNQLEPETFADLVIRNTDLNNVHSTHISGTAFSTPDLILELDRDSIGIAHTAQDNTGLGALDPTWGTTFQQLFDPKVVRVLAGFNAATGARVDVNGDGVIDGKDNLLKFSGGEHVVLGGTEGNDTLIGDKGIDTLWGDGGDDYLNAGTESDQVFGGEGDDIIEDPFGDNFLRGNQGNDVISSGHGLSFLFGDQGNDFIRASTDIVEVFAGEGDDFVLGGSAADVLSGNEGDDWIEGGEGFDNLSGENSELFFNSPIVGHDILNGQGNDTDYDGENGDDIMVQSSGIQRNNGMDGFDWAIHKGDAIGADSDLGIRVFDARPALILRDRFDSVEGLSGWKLDDKLTGAAKLILGENFDNRLTQAGVDRIAGLQGVIGGVHQADPNAVVFGLRAFDGSEVILGGDGSDVIRGNLGNDIIDGDAWLNVRIAVHSTVVNPVTGLFGPGDTVLFSVDSLNEISARMLSRGADHINPGQLKAVREILYDTAANGTNPADTNVDIAAFSGARGDYTITPNADGSLTITDNGHVNAGAADPFPARAAIDGTDTLRNIERLQFIDGVFATTNLAVNINTAPTAVVDMASTVANVPVTINVLANDSVSSPASPAELGQTLTITAINGTAVIEGGSVNVANGSVTLTAGKLVFTPAAGFSNAVATFTYTVSDGAGGTATAGVGVTVNSAANTPPVITSPAAFTVPENTAVATVVADVNATDTQTPTGLTYALDPASPDFSRFTINAATGEIRFVASPNFEAATDVGTNNVYNVTARVTDAGGLATTQALTVTVTNVNEAPVVSIPIADRTATAGTALSFALPAGTFTDPDAGTTLALTARLASGAVLPTWLTFNAATGTFSGTPPTGAGTVVVRVTATDGGALSTFDDFNIVVGGPANNPPVAVPVTLAAIAEDSGVRLITSAQLLAGVTDTDGPSPLSITALAIATGLGTLVNNNNGTWNYTPALNDSTAVTFNYSATDGAATASSTASLDITPVNDAPVAAPVTLAAIAEDSGVRQITSAQLLAGVTDVDGPPATITALSIAAGGLGTLVNAGAGVWNYTPALNDSSAVTFNYTASDGTLTASSTASLDITPVNDAPVAAPVTLAPIAANSGVRLITSAQLLGGVTDVDGPALSITALTIASGLGTLVNNNNGSWNYTPALNDSTAVTFTYTATDGSLNASSTASLDITPVGSVITGTAANDVLTGTAGADRIDGLGGADTMTGGLGDDTYVVDNVTTQIARNNIGDLVIEAVNGGIDTVETSLNSLSLLLGNVGPRFTNVENLTFTGTGAFVGTGNELNNTITGGNAADTLSGNGGDDRLVGRGGNDTMTGGAGSDTIVLQTGFGNDTVTDFDSDAAGGQDFIDISGFGITAANFAASVTITDLGADTLVTIGTDGTLRLIGVTGDGANVITQADFGL